MLLPKKILVPVDFSATSEYVLEYAVALARPLGAEILVLHAYDTLSFGALGGGMIATSDLTERILRGAQDGLATMLSAHQVSGVTIRSMLKQEDAWRAILDVAKEAHSDLIMMGTHGRRGIAHALLGSVAEKVVRTAPCPVLTIRGVEEKT